jgi:hypothetical protein
VKSPALEGSGKIVTQLEMDCEMGEDRLVKLTLYDGAGAVLGDKSLTLSPNDEGVEKDITIKGGKKAIKVRVAMVVAKRLSVDDMVEASLEFVATSEKPWYLKGQDLYSVAKKIYTDVYDQVTDKVGEEHTKSVEEALTKATSLVDRATESVLKRCTSMTMEDNFSVLEKVDELLALSMVHTDALVDNSREKFVVSVRALKSALMGQTERLVEASTSSLSGLLQRWNTLKLTATDRLATIQADVTTGAKTYLDNAKQTVAAKTSEVITTAEPMVKSAIARSHPYVQQAYVAGQPYAVQAMEVSQPYVSQAQPIVAPYLAKAMQFIDDNQLASELVQQGSGLVDSARSFYGSAVGTDAEPALPAMPSTGATITTAAAVKAAAPVPPAVVVIEPPAAQE